MIDPLAGPWQPDASSSPEALAWSVIFSIKKVATWIPFDGHFQWFSIGFPLVFHVFLMETFQFSDTLVADGIWMNLSQQQEWSPACPEDSNSYLTWQLLYYSHGNRCLAQLGWCLALFPSQTNSIATTKMMDMLNRVKSILNERFAIAILENEPFRHLFEGCSTWPIHQQKILGF